MLAILFVLSLTMYYEVCYSDSWSLRLFQTKTGRFSKKVGNCRYSLVVVDGILYKYIYFSVCFNARSIVSKFWCKYTLLICSLLSIWKCSHKAVILNLWAAVRYYAAKVCDKRLEMYAQFNIFFSIFVNFLR